MERRKKIDRTLTERHGILRLLERLQKDNISIDEIEEIGTDLQKAGGRALSPLVRRLWREKNGDLISRYAYLLDFFEDEAWIDQLIQIALRRRDLEDEGKAALLAALEGYGVDVSTPPFATLLARVGGPLQLTLPRLLDRGEEGMICFVEDLLFCDLEGRVALIGELPSVADPRIIPLLEVLAGIDDPNTAGAAVMALGRVRDAAAAMALEGLRNHPDAAVRQGVEKSLRRLAFVGIAAGPRPEATSPLPFYAAYASPFDGAGLRTIWLGRRQEGGELAALYMQFHEVMGMTAAWGESGLTEEEFARQLAEIRGEEWVVEVAPEYALRLIRDAMFHSRQDGAFLPPEFYVRRSMFRPEELDPAPYRPEFAGHDLKALAVSSRLIAASATLFDDDCFAGWFLATSRVYDFAEEWLALEKRAAGRELSRGMEELLARFCAELVTPQIELIGSRLLSTADLLQRSGGDRDVVEKTLATGLSVTGSGLPPHRHPFLKRFALESMDMAREALAEGYDLREHPGSGDDEWE